MLVAALLVVIAGGILSVGAWTRPVRWTPDSLFYEAQAREVGGENAAAARKAVFAGPLGRSVRDEASRVRDPRWVAYAAPFFRRRWVTPVTAAAVKPFFGDRSLLAISTAGYLLSGLGALLLLRRRFGLRAAFVGSLAVLAFPPLRAWSAYPLSDSMGVAALFGCLLAGWRAQVGSRWHVAAWACATLVLAFTRDATAIPVLAAAAYALTARTKRSLAVATAGIVAAVPAALFGAPLRRTLAFTFSGNAQPSSESWSFIVHKYGEYVSAMISNDFPIRDCLPLTAASVGAIALLGLPSGSARTAQLRRRVVAGILVATSLDLLLYDHLRIYGEPLAPGVMLLLGLLPLFAPTRADDVLVRFARMGALAGVAYLFVLPEYTQVRLGLVLLPFSAIGVGRTVAWWTALGESSRAEIAEPRLTGRRPEIVPTFS